MLKVDSSSWSRAATVRSSREKDSDGFMALSPAWTARISLCQAVLAQLTPLELKAWVLRRSREGQPHIAVLLFGSLSLVRGTIGLQKLPANSPHIMMRASMLVS